MNTIYVTKHKDGRLAVVKKPTADSVAYVLGKYVLEGCNSGARAIEELEKELRDWKMLTFIFVIVVCVNIFLRFIL
jgi:hypothetical protein